MKSRQGGFSLIELLIVVAIILIIAAIAIPNLRRAKMQANEASAVGSLRTITSAAILYSATYGGYPPNIPSLGGSGPTPSTSSAELIDSVLATGTKSGYNFEYAPESTDGNSNVLTYAIAASPVSLGVTGQRRFYTDQSGVIRSNATGRANANSTPIN